MFQKHISTKDWKEWNEFYKVAQESSRRLNIILKVTLAWGNEVVTHYNFVSKCRDYCENLRAVAMHNNQCQPWVKVVRILNTSIWSRIQRNDGRSKVSDSCNPILPQDLAYTKRILKGDATFVNDTTEELFEDYGLDQHGLIVRRRFAASSLSPSAFHGSPKLIILSSQASDTARDCNVTPAPSGQGPPSPSSRLTTTLEAIDFATESPSSLGQCSSHTSPAEYNRTTLVPSSSVPASSPSSAAPGLTFNETSPQSLSSLVEIPQTQSIGCNDASRLPEAFLPSSSSSTSCQQGSRSAESPCAISEPTVSPTSPSSSSVSHRLLPSSPLATTKSRNSEHSLSPPEEFSHNNKSNIIEPPEVAYLEDDTAIKEELSQTATIAFSSPVEVTNNLTRSPSTHSNPAFSPPSLSPRSSFHHKVTQTLTATSNCCVDGAFTRTVTPCSPTKPEGFKSPSKLVRKRSESNFHDESSLKKQKGCSLVGDPATAWITPLRPLLPVASGSDRLDSQATINSTDSQSSPSSQTLRANPWLRDAMLSLHLLDKNKWLNDAIINAILHILARRHGFCFFNSHFLQSGSSGSGNRKAEYGDPLESDLVLMPIHECFHWYLLVIYKLSGIGHTIQKDRAVCFLNSLVAPSRSYERNFTLWTQYFKNIGCPGTVHQRNIKIPQQSNNTDCGVFHLAFAYQIVQDRQKFVDAVENGTGLHWKIDAPKWRELIRVQLTSTNNTSAVVNTAAENIVYMESDDDTCVEVVSVCHAVTSSVERDPATGHDVTAHTRRDDFNVAKTVYLTTHDSIIARTLNPSPPSLRPSLSSWPADSKSSVSLTLPPSQPTYQDAIGRFGQSVEIGDAGTDADRDGNDEKMLDGSTLVAPPLEAAFASFNPSFVAVSTPSQSSGTEVIRL